MALGLQACSLATPPGASPVVLSSAQDAGDCLRETEAQARHAAHLALVLDCAARTGAAGSANEAAEAALARVVLAAYDETSGRFRDVTLAPNVAITTEGLPAGKYLLLDTGQTPARDGVIAGKGLPMVLERPSTGSAPFRPPEGALEPVAITATTSRQGETLTVTLRAVTGAELREGGWVDAAGRAYLLLLDRARLREESTVGFREPEPETFRRDGIYMIEPYDPDRIPVVMIHGLRSSPEVWRGLSMHILSRPELHRRFQVWHVFYPTGLPPFYSASQVRQKLRNALRTYDPDGDDLPSRRMAVIGHSMGGIIARALVTEDAGLLWRTSFLVPPEQLRVSPQRREELRGILSLQAEPQIGFAGFINVPHRGSRIAIGPIGRLGSALIRLPFAFTALFEAGGPSSAQMTEEMRPYLSSRLPDSVRVLSPDHPLLAALADLPPAPGVRVASVIGVRRGPDCVAQPDCKATDGVVAFDSARLPFGTELVVKGGHDGHSDPAAIAFLSAELLDWAKAR